MSKYDYVKDEWVKQALEEYKDKIDNNKSHKLDVSSYKVDKPWGHEEIIAHTDKYVMKKLVIKAGHRLSKQFHIKK